MKNTTHIGRNRIDYIIICSNIDLGKLKCITCYISISCTNNIINKVFKI